jgi:hypothetical protein
MSHVWNILNTLRIVNLIPDFHNMENTMPLNVREIMNVFKTIAELKIIDGAAIYDSIRNYIVVNKDPPAE